MASATTKYREDITAVDIQPAQGLQRHLYGKLRRFADLQKRVLCANFPILGNTGRLGASSTPATRAMPRRGKPAQNSSLRLRFVLLSGSSFAVACALDDQIPCSQKHSNSGRLRLTGPAALRPGFSSSQSGELPQI